MLGMLIVLFICIGVLLKPKETTFLYCICSPIIYNFSFHDANVVISIFVFVAFVFHRERIVSWRKNPFFFPILLVVFSTFISNFFSIFPHNGLVYRKVIYATTIFIVGHYLLRGDERYLGRCIKMLKVLTIIVFFNSLIELITLRNPFNELMLSLGIYDKTTVATYVEFRYGIKRCQSIFGMKTTLGGFGLILFSAFVYIRYIGKIKIHQMYLLMGGGMVLLSGTRSVIMGAIVMLLSFVSKKIRQQLSPVQMAFGALILLLFMGNYLLDVLNSFSSTDSISGSSSEMRRGQFELAFFYMMKSPFLGNGLSYSWTHVVALYAKEALGLESCWFPIMIDQGLFGCVAYISFYLTGCFRAIKKKDVVIFFVFVAWLVANSMSSLPGLNDIFYMPLFILLYTIGMKGMDFSLQKRNF